MFDHLIQVLSALSLFEWFVAATVWFLATLLAHLAFARWLLRRQWKLYRNLKRPVIVLRPVSSLGDVIPGGDMTQVIRLLKGSGFLNVESSPTDYRSYDPAGKHSVVVLGYRAGMAGLDDLLNRIKSKHVPLIVYTFGVSPIEDRADKEKLDSYPYALFANFPLTLLNHIFATVASYPYERK